MNRQIPQGYPKQMTHPHYKPAVISNSRNPNTPFHGEPVRFPPVMVYGPDAEEYHKSRGYVSQG